MSKLLLCKSCFAELLTATNFCPCCGAPIVASDGYDIYNKGDNFYLRYRKDKQKAQVPLAPNYTKLPSERKRLIYTNAKKELLAKLVAKALLPTTQTNFLKIHGNSVVLTRLHP